MNLYSNGEPGSNRLVLPGPPQVTNIFQMAVAPQLVARTRFSPPPPKSNLCPTIPEALELLKRKIKGNCSSIDSVVIAGPGDPLATPELTFEAVDCIKAKYPDLKIGINTYGIGSSQLASRVSRAGIHHVEMVVEAVRTEVIEKLFAWIRPGTKTMKLSEAAHLLIKEQASGVSALKFYDLKVTILTTLYPGYNIDHVPKISSEMKELGADGMTLVPYHPGIGVEVELESPTPEEVMQTRYKASVSLPLVEPLYESSSCYLSADQPHDSLSMLQLSSERPHVAVVSSNGIEVDLHLGHAIKFLIYGKRSDGLACLLETRKAPEPGSGSSRWLEIAGLLNDCSLVLTSSAGENPRRILAEHGIKVHITEENIEAIIDTIYGGGKKKKNA